MALNKQQYEKLMAAARKRSQASYEDVAAFGNQKILEAQKRSLNTKNVGPIVGGTLFRAKEESPTQNTTSYVPDTFRTYQRLGRDLPELPAPKKGISLQGPVRGLDESIATRVQTEHMTPEEKKLYETALERNGLWGAYQYQKQITPQVNQRVREETEQNARRFANEHPVLASAASIAMSPLKPIELAGQTYDLVTGNGLDPNAPYNWISHNTSAIREEVPKDFNDVGKFTYQVGMSLGDFLADLSIGGLGLAKGAGKAALKNVAENGFAKEAAAEIMRKSAGKNALALMSTGAAADTVIDAKDRGLSDGQAYALGLVAGGAEALTEKFSLEYLLKHPKSIGSYIRQNMLVEGSEEGAADIINLAADSIISKDKAEWRQELEYYKSQGLSDKEAMGQTIRNQLKNIGLDMLGGALAGGVLSGGAVGFQKGRQLLSDYQRKTFQREEDTSEEQRPPFERYRVANQKVENAWEDLKENRGEGVSGKGPSWNKSGDISLNQRRPSNVQGQEPQIEEIQKTRERDLRAVEEFAGTMGKAGGTVLQSMYQPQQNAEQYIYSMNGYYNAGKQGVPFGMVSSKFNNEGTNLKQQQAAFLAGQADSPKTEGPKVKIKEEVASLPKKVEIEKPIDERNENQHNEAVTKGKPVLTAKTLISRLKQVEKASQLDGDYYVREAYSNDWENYGKHRVYFSITEKGRWDEKKHRYRHYKTADYGYLDVVSGEYHPGKAGDLSQDSVLNWAGSKKVVFHDAVPNIQEVNSEESTNTKEREADKNEKSMGKIHDVGSAHTPSLHRESAGGILDGVPSEDVRQDVQGGDVVQDVGEERRGALGLSDGTDETGDVSRYGVGVRESGDLQPASGERGRLEEESAGDTQTKEVENEEVEVQAEEAESEEEIEEENYVIPEEGFNLPKGPKSRFKANVNAIKALKKIMAENRGATKEEQQILSQYTGWGGLSEAFDDQKSTWSKEYKELKGILSEDEYKRARSSVLNAYFTNPNIIRAMYDGLQALGFKGGEILEPSAGVGHFAGAMPEKIVQRDTKWHMVELDTITGNIARYLYPKADVRVEGFENAEFSDNSMDLVIGNVPFGNERVFDKTYPKVATKTIHNYFIAKSLNKVHPGGIVCLITSRYTLDSTDSSFREYIVERADLLGAIRLPNTAFKENAGTNVVSDIIVLRKREEGATNRGQRFLDANPTDFPELQITVPVNEYFEENPQDILGEPAKGSMHNQDGLTYKPKGGDLAEQIKESFLDFADFGMTLKYPAPGSQKGSREEPRQTAAKTEKKADVPKDGSIVQKAGKLLINKDGKLEAVPVSEKQSERLKRIVAIRDKARELLDLQLEGAADAKINQARKQLNNLYDKFVKEHGFLNNVANKKLVNKDADSPFILALENYDSETDSASKADMFSKNTVSPVHKVEHVDTIEEALAVSMNESGKVDLTRIAQLTGKEKPFVEKWLLENERVFKNPNGELETAEQYLSGNVRAKLAEARAMFAKDKSYEKNLKALYKVIPPDIEPEDIKVTIGSTWIPDDVYTNFAARILDIPFKRNVKVTYNKLTGQYYIEASLFAKRRPGNTVEFGTPKFTFLKIFEAMLNNGSIRVWKKTSDGKRVVDKQETALAQEMKEKIASEFQSWVWGEDSPYRQDLSRLYNDMFNNFVFPQYDGKDLTVDGMNSTKPLREHQKNAVQRIVSSGGNTLLAHRVGAGKTYEMAAAAMKLRQLGVVKKPMFVVPKALISQWGKEFLDFFPNAKILVSGQNDFTAGNRKIFVNKIATGDFDAVIVSREQFKKIPVGSETQKEFYETQIQELDEALELERSTNRKSLSIRKMESKKKSLETKLKKLADQEKDKDNINFESLGVDSLFVDEAHEYKNLFYTTNMSNVGGLGDQEGSQRAFDLYMKVRYLQKLNGGRGIVFATATPVMNSITEMYIMQKYLQGDLLEEKKIYNFDAWANQFGEVRNVLELNPSGKGYRQKEMLSRFKNLPELQQMFRAFADVLTDIPGLNIPQMKGGKRTVIESEATEFQTSYIDDLVRRSDAIKSGKVDPKEDNMLKINIDGRKLSYTGKMVDPSLPYEENGKIAMCADKVYETWKASKNNKGTQIIFCDLSTPKGENKQSNDVEAPGNYEEDSPETDTIYEHLKNILMAKGVPEKEIAFIHDAKNDEQRLKLFGDVNEGKVRILIGSTGKMGVGMNAQKRVVALHHLDAPHRPGDIEQREGRALRQGNMNNEVEVCVYVTKNTFDSRMWDNLERKSAFIHQVMEGNYTARESEGDGDFALSAAEIKAIASGSPLIMEQFEVASEISRLENLERAHRKRAANAKAQVKQLEIFLSEQKEKLKLLMKDFSDKKDTQGDNFSITILKTKYTDRKEAGEAIIEQVKKQLSIKIGEKSTVKIGSFAGFDLLAASNGDVILEGELQYKASVNMKSPSGTIQSLEGLVRRIGKQLDATEKSIPETNSSITKFKKIASEPFERASDLAKARKRNEEILLELNPPSEQEGLAIEEETSYLKAEDDDQVSYAIGAGSNHYSQQWKTKRIEEGTVTTPMSPSDIIRKIEHDFSINITKGHVQNRKARGQYNKKNNGIRIRIANDLPPVAHELGHSLDNKYSISKKEKLSEPIKAELMQALGDLRTEYPPKQRYAEGFAEYVRQFIVNPDEARMHYPKLTDYFLGSLSPKDLSLIIHLADEVNAQLSLESDTASSSISLRGEKETDFRTNREKVRDWFNRWYQTWVDSNYGIKLFSDEAGDERPYILATNAAYANSVAGRLIEGGPLTDIDGRYVGPGLVDALADINLTNDEEYRDFGEYLVVKHGPERLEEGQRVFSSDAKNNKEWMEARRIALEEEYPEFKEASEKLYAFQERFLQTWGVETELITQDTADTWLERWKYYVPFNRNVGKKGGMGQKRSFAGQSAPTKRSFGSGLDIINPVDNIMNNIIHWVTASMCNRPAASIARIARREGVDALFLEEVEAPVQRNAFRTEDVLKKVRENAENLGMDVTGLAQVDLALQNIDEVFVQYSRAYRSKDERVVMVLEDGKPTWWKVNDPLLLESLTTLSQPQLSGILKAIKTTTRIISANATGRNLVWSLFSNSPRDFVTMLVYAKKGNRGAILLNYFKGLKEAFNTLALGRESKDPYFDEFLSVGGNSNSVYSADMDLTKKARKKLMGKTLNPLEFYGFLCDLTESGPRFAFYKTLRKKGIDPQTAIYEAHDITVNFFRGGRGSREVGAFVPFFNAGVQGVDKFARFLLAQDVPKERRKKVTQDRVITGVAVSAFIALLFSALNHKDDETEKYYNQLSNYTKNAYFCIPWGDGRFFAIPKPRELAVGISFFESLIERMGGNERAFSEFANYVIDNVLPPLVSDLAQLPVKASQQGAQEGLEDTVATTLGSAGLIGTFSYILANRDFLGRPIVSAGMENLEPKDQYTRRTSAVAVGIGQVFNISPQKLDFFLQQLFGGVQKWNKSLFPIGEENRSLSFGIKGSYIKDSLYSTDIVNWIYDQKERSARAKNSDPENVDKAINAKMDSNMSTFYSRYYKLDKDAVETQTSRGVRQTVLDMLLEYQKADENGILTPAQKELYAFLKDAGTVSGMLPSAMDTEVTNKEGEKYSLSAAQYVEYQTNYNRIYWETVEDLFEHQVSKEATRKALENAVKLARETATNQILAQLGGGTTDSTWALWATAGEAWGVDESEALLFKTAYDMTEGDKNRKGETISGSKKKNVLEVVNEWMPELTREELNYLQSLYWTPGNRKLKDLKDAGYK